MLQYAQGYEPRKEVSFVMVGQSTTNYMHDFLAEFFAGAEKVSRQPCEDKMSVYQWSVPGARPAASDDGLATCRSLEFDVHLVAHLHNTPCCCFCSRDFLLLA